ncbi:ATP-binding protein [Shouchella shacheensis]|uniref:ATP-binding protein n=1 Tax=Shouchella shacheensis TaxID=1649580 RepID=UPI0007403213|nr:ATP-binding protein [Shouchella shacheensis]
MRKTTLPLRYQMMLYSSGLICLALLVTGVMIALSQADQTREALASQARLSASHFAETPLVAEALATEGAHEELRQLAEDVRVQNGLQYIVVMNMEGIRLTHPVPERVGQHFVGGDVQEVLQGQTYTSEAVGTLGPSMRAFQPVYDDGVQVGAVSVGISTEVIDGAVWDSQRMVFIGTGVSLALGIIGSYFLARRLKKTLRGLEPKEISQLVQEREAMLEGVREGIMATDAKGEIVVANKTATTILKRAGYTATVTGERIENVWPSLSLDSQLASKEAAYDEQKHLGELEMVASRVPVIVDGHCVGALVTFRDRNELSALMKKLTGVETYAQTLRAQTHEFMNKLHIIGAMVYTESYEELADYVESLSLVYQRDTGRIAEHMEDVTIAGYLLTQLERFEQAGVEVTLFGKKWPRLEHPTLMDTWITVMGNSLENAYEAMLGKEQKALKLTFDQEEDELVYTIEDNGEGFSEADLPLLIQKGYSTKGPHRGYGLSIMANAIHEADGSYDVSSTPGQGTVLQVRLPLKQGGGEET